MSSPPVLAESAEKDHRHRLAYLHLSDLCGSPRRHVYLPLLTPSVNPYLGFPGWWNLRFHYNIFHAGGIYVSTRIWWASGRSRWKQILQPWLLKCPWYPAFWMRAKREREPALHVLYNPMLFWRSRILSSKPRFPPHISSCLSSRVV